MTANQPCATELRSSFTKEMQNTNDKEKEGGKANYEIVKLSFAGEV